MDKFKVNLKQNEGTMEILFNSSVLIQNESLKQYLLKQQYHIFGLFEKYFWNENFLVITPIQLILSSTQHNFERNSFLKIIPLNNDFRFYEESSLKPFCFCIQNKSINLQFSFNTEELKKNCMELLNQLLLKLGLEQNQQLLIPSFNFSSQTDPYFGFPPEILCQIKACGFTGQEIFSNLAEILCAYDTFFQTVRYSYTLKRSREVSHNYRTEIKIINNKFLAANSIEYMGGPLMYLEMYISFILTPSSIFYGKPATIEMGLIKNIKQVKEELSILFSVHHPNIYIPKEVLINEDKIYLLGEPCSISLVCILEQYDQFRLSEREIAFVIRETLKGIAALNRVPDRESLFNRCCYYVNENRNLFPLLTHLPQDIIEHLETSLHFPMTHGYLTCDCILIYDNSDIKIRLPPYSSISTYRLRRCVVGTPYWLSPRIIQGEEISLYDDIWDIAVLLKECVDGEPPYMDYPPLKALFLIQTKGLPPFQSTFVSKEMIEFYDLCIKMANKLEFANLSKLFSHPFIIGSNQDMEEFQIRSIFQASVAYVKKLIENYHDC